MEQKPSFFQSLTAGVIGMAKGMLLLGAAGFLLGGVVGGIFAMTSHMINAGPVALAFAASFAELGATIGGIAGAVTGVVQSREVQAADPHDILTMAQSVSAGRDKNISKESPAQAEQASTKFQDKLKAEKPQALGR